MNVLSLLRKVQERYLGLANAGRRTDGSHSLMWLGLVFPEPQAALEMPRTLGRLRQPGIGSGDKSHSS